MTRPLELYKKKKFIFASQATRGGELLLHSIGRLHEGIDMLEAIKLIPGIWHPFERHESRKLSPLLEDFTNDSFASSVFAKVPRSTDEMQ